MPFLISGLICVFLKEPQQSWIRTLSGTRPKSRPKSLTEEGCPDMSQKDDKSDIWFGYELANECYFYLADSDFILNFSSSHLPILRVIL